MRTVVKHVAASVASLATVIGCLIALDQPAFAVDTTPRVMATTQRMTGPHLTNFYQHGTYAAGTDVTLYCYERGQGVTGYFSHTVPDNLWYQTTDGHWIADVDIETGSNDPVVGSCIPSVDTNQWYEIVSKNSSKAVDVAGASTANGAHLQQYTRNNSNAQRFRFAPTSDGYYRIVPKTSSAQGWDISGRSTSNGAKAQVWTYGGGTNQQFMVHKVAGGGYRFTPRHVTNRCLDVPSASTKDSIQLQIWTCNSAPNQTFNLNATGVVSPVSWAGDKFCTSSAFQDAGRHESSSFLAAGAGGVAICQGSYTGTVSYNGITFEPAGDRSATAWQCVEYAGRYFYAMTGVSTQGRVTRGNGRDIARNLAADFGSRGYTLHGGSTNTRIDSTLKPGAILSMIPNTSGPGHVGVVKSVSSSSVQLYGENQSGHQYITITVSSGRMSYHDSIFGTAVGFQWVTGPHVGA